MTGFAAKSSRSIGSRVGGRSAAAACFVAALAVYGIESVAWPLSYGRDGATYLLYYLDMWHSRPAYPELMLFRTPLAPLFFGPLLQLGGAALAEIALALAYAVSVLAYAATAAAAFGRRVAVLVAAALLLYPPYGALFHQLSSDSVFAFVLALWVLAVVRTLVVPATWKFALHGVALLALVLARPSAQVLLLFVLVPLGLRFSWGRRLTWAGAFLGVAVGLLAAWAGYNDIRYGDFAVSRSSGADVPFYRVFVLDKLVSPANGPSSRKLADAVRRELLPTPAYEGVSLPEFFAVANDNMWGDLVVLSDQSFGWSSDYSILRKVALEAIRTHPKPYFASVERDARSLLVGAYSLPARARVRHDLAPAAPATQPAAPRPLSEAGGYLWWLASTSDGHIRRGLDAAGQSRLLWRSRAEQAHADQLARHLQTLASDLPNRDGSASVASFLNRISRIYPRMALWLVLGLLAMLVRRPRGSAAILVLAALGLATIGVTLLGFGPTLEYRLPFDPIFIVLGLGALAGPGRSLVSVPSRLRRFRSPV